MATGCKHCIAARRRISGPGVGSSPSPIPRQGLLHVARCVRDNPTMASRARIAKGHGRTKTTGCSLQAAARRFRSTMSFGYACARSHGWVVAHASRYMKEPLTGDRRWRAADARSGNAATGCDAMFAARRHCWRYSSSSAVCLMRAARSAPRSPNRSALLCLKKRSLPWALMNAML